MSKIHLSVTANAGPLKVTTNTIRENSLYQTVFRGDDGGSIYLYFDSETAKQWISALAPIATKEPL